MGRRPIDFKSLRDLVRPQVVLETTGWRPERWAGRNAVGPCPLCGADSWRKGCMLVGSRVAKCLRCGWFGDALALYCLLHHCDVYTAALGCCDLFGLPIPFIDRPRLHT